MPASPRSMNYVSVLYVALAVAILLDWCLRARSEFRGHLTRKKDAVGGIGRDVVAVAGNSRSE